MLLLYTFPTKFYSPFLSTVSDDHCIGLWPPITTGHRYSPPISCKPSSTNLPTSVISFFRFTNTQNHIPHKPLHGKQQQHLPKQHHWAQSLHRRETESDPRLALSKFEHLHLWHWPTLTYLRLIDQNRTYIYIIIKYYIYKLKLQKYKFIGTKNEKKNIVTKIQKAQQKLYI